MTDAQQALAQVREALAAGPTPGAWACYDDSNDGKTSRIEIVAIGKTVARIYRSVQEQDLPNARLIAACSPANIAAILAHVEAQAAEIERLTAERDELRRQLDPMGEYASADELIAALRAEKAEDEAMKLDARRYRDWLRGGANIPSESSRWARWEVRHWNGRHWHTLFAEALDANIDAAMGLTRPAEE